jgi:hypothetical protein
MERAGLVSARQNARAIADLRRPAPPAVVNPPEIRTDIQSGQATADLLRALDDAGIVNDQSQAGSQAASGPRDDRVLPSDDKNTVVDGAMLIYSDQARAWLPTTDPTLNSLIVGGLTVNGGIRLGGSGTPTVTPGSSAGASAHVDNVAGHEYNGYFELTASGTTSTGQVARVQFANALGNTNYGVWLQDESGTLGPKNAYVRDKTTSGFYVGMATAPTSGQVYKITYLVLGRSQ